MAPRKNYTPDQIEKAVEAVKNGEKVASAAQRFGIPRITLHDKITRRTSIGCSMGPSTILTKSEEDILERWLLTLSEKHIPLTKDCLLDSVQKLIMNQNRKNPFTNNRPGKKWFQSFMKRHPNLSQRVPDNLSRARDNVSEGNIRTWFKEIESYLDEHNLKPILNNPHRLFNTDESAFFLSPKPDRVIVKKGDKHPYSRCGDEKDNLTVLITGNAAGDLAPPMIVFSYERIPSSVAASVPDEWAIGKSESGWMCSSTFYEYVTNVFNPWLEQNNIEKPILFFVDGHKSHLTLHLSNFCSQNGIEIFALYPNSTHILQPMDLSVFRPLKAYWRKAVTQWKMENLGQNLRKENFAPVLQKSLRNITKDYVKNGFRAAGLFPFGPDYMDMSKIRPKEISTKANPGQTEFVRYLENEIIKVFSAEKLDQFNKLYFENRSTLESNIPKEDVALYVIWAKNKSDDLCRLGLSNAASTSDTLEEVDVISNHITTAQLIEVLTEESPEIENNEQTKNTSKDTNSNDFIESVFSTHNLKKIVDTTVGVPFETLSSTNVLKEIEDHHCQQPNYNTEVDTIINQPLPLLSSPTDLPEVTRDPPVEKPNIYNNIETPIDQALPPLASSSSSDIPKTIIDCISQEPIISTMVLQDITPQKKSMESVLGVIVPSPFKRSLFWPEIDSNKKKMKREKIPSTVTSKAWKEYHEKKEAERNKKQQEKEERAKQKLEKKKLKEQLANDKKNKSCKTKTAKRKVKRNREELTSESDMDISYAESDISYDEPDSLSSDFENMPLSKLPSSKATKLKKGKKFSIGSFVIIKYEGEYFPGKVESLRKNEFEISTMTLTTGNTFKWPNAPDKMFYGPTEIMEEIKEPICLNKRGFYRIPEMDKYLPNIYNI